MTNSFFLEPLRPIASRLSFKAVILALAGIALIALAIAGAARLAAQIEGDRGIPPVARSEDIQVSGIKVNVTADSGEDARREGWRIAQRKAWEKIQGPQISDSQLDGMVTAIVIEREQIGPRRYIAELGVIFDRVQAGRFIGSSGDGERTRSAPLLVIPILESGGVQQVFEVKGQWQRAWATFQAGESPIDYVRPTGAGGESLIVTAGQPGRRSRQWWRYVLDQFEAADVLIPVARLERQWPGGPVHGTFTARYGPDNISLGSFRLAARNDAAVPEMLDQALVRLDSLYRDAFAQGKLKPDPTLMTGERAFDAALAKLQAALAPKLAETASGSEVYSETPVSPSPVPTQTVVSTFTVQFVSPDASAVDAALAAVRGVAGVQSAATTSLAIGGTSVMRVTMAGDLNALAISLRAQGWNVSVGSNALRISR